MPIISSPPGIPYVAPGANNNVLTSNGTKWTSATAAAGGIPNAQTLVGNFETAGRYTATTTGSATATFNTAGLRLDTTASTTDSVKVAWNAYNLANNSVFLGSPVFSFNISSNIDGSDFDKVWCAGSPTVAAASITFTDRHIGFKETRVTSGTINVYGTQADGTTESATASLATVTAGGSDEIDGVATANGTTSVDYRYRKNGGALSAATNNASNFPTGSNVQLFTVAVSNRSTASASRAISTGVSLTR